MCRPDHTLRFFVGHINLSDALIGSLNDVKNQQELRMTQVYEQRSLMEAASRLQPFGPIPEDGPVELASQDITQKNAECHDRCQRPVLYAASAFHPGRSQIIPIRSNRAKIEREKSSGE